MLDLLTFNEDKMARCHLSLDLLSERLAAGLQWINAHARFKELPVGLFAANTAASAAFVLAASLGDSIRAIVTRSGRPNAAIHVLHQVRCPALMIVGSVEFPGVMNANNEAYGRLAGMKKLAVVPGASRLFSEPEALQEMAALATDWFSRYVTPDGHFDAVSRKAAV